MTRDSQTTKFVTEHDDTVYEIAVEIGSDGLLRLTEPSNDPDTTAPIVMPIEEWGLFSDAVAALIRQHEEATA